MVITKVFVGCYPKAGVFTLPNIVFNWFLNFSSVRKVFFSLQSLQPHLNAKNAEEARMPKFERMVVESTVSSLLFLTRRVISPNSKENLSHLPFNNLAHK